MYILLPNTDRNHQVEDYVDINNTSMLNFPNADKK